MKVPLTRYLEWEWLSYSIRASMGERIVVVRHHGSLPDEEHFDYLLFDSTAALVHDYGDDGLQVGGWLVREAGVIQRLEALALDLRGRAAPFPNLTSAA